MAHHPKTGDVAELEDGSVGMGQTELIKVMDMGDAEVERREEDDPGGRHLGQQV